MCNNYSYRLHLSHIHLTPSVSFTKKQEGDPILPAFRALKDRFGFTFPAPVAAKNARPLFFPSAIA